MKNRDYKIPFYLIFFFLYFLIGSCELNKKIDPVDEMLPYSDNTGFDCEKFKSFIIENNQDSILKVISKLTISMNPSPNDSDLIGHKQNFEVLLNKLNDCEGINAELICYACIITNPPQTEILITLDSLESQIKRVLDFSTPHNNHLQFVDIHEYYENDIVELNNTEYSGCFNGESMKRGNSQAVSTDTVYYKIKDDTLTLSVLMNYNCCGLLKDSVVISEGQVDIYIADTCVSNCLCKCICDFGFEYQFTNIWKRNIHFYIYRKSFNETRYQLWRQTKFIDGLD